jgi:Flp pilus assembly protein TadG
LQGYASVNRATRGGTQVNKRRDERGAAMVEFAIILPLVLLLTFGLIDFGFAFADAAGIKSATRSGARIGSALSKQPGQLQSIVAAVNAGLANSTRAQATEIVIYAAPPAGFSAPSTCAGGTTASSSSMCFGQVIPANVPDRFTLTQGDADAWDNALHFQDACPAVGNTISAWRLSVTVKATYPFLTNMMGPNIHLHETVVIDLEPTSTGNCAPS